MPGREKVPLDFLRKIQLGNYETEKGKDTILSLPNPEIDPIELSGELTSFSTPVKEEVKLNSEATNQENVSKAQTILSLNLFTLAPKEMFTEFEEIGSKT